VQSTGDDASQFCAAPAGLQYTSVQRVLAHPKAWHVHGVGLASGLATQAPVLGSQA
jgi:hypothetical protein